MYTPTYQNVHSHFKLNGFHMDRDNLCRVAYTFIKEGEDFEKPVGSFLLDWFDHHDYIEMQTSGTTGEPKTVRVSKQAMVHSALATGDFFDLKPGDRVLHCLPVKYVAGKMMLIRAMILGLDVEFVAPNSKPMKRAEGTFEFAAMVPMQAKNSLPELHRIKKLIIGGARINHQLENELKKQKTQVFETFGMTETITHIAAREIHENYFRVLPHVTITYDDRNCLVIHAPHIIKEETIITNDLVELIDENHFRFLGRIDNVINSGGIKIIPEVIESKLSPAIDARFFVIGKEDNELGEKVVLVVEGEKQELNESIFSDLDKYQKPKETIFVSNFIENENGKVLRKDTLKSV